LKEIVIKDNGSFGDWDMDMLANEWDDLPLKEWGVDIAWDNVFLEETAPQDRKEAEEDDFDVEKDHIEVRCKRGDIWQLGDHRLMCGDSVDLEDVKRLMGGVEADMVFTDPPYGIDYSGGRTQTVSKKDYGKLKNDNLQGEELGNLICNIFQFNKKGADVYVCVSPIMQKPFLDYLDRAGKKTDAVIVWDKKQPGLGYMAYRRQCEFILFIKGGQFHKGDKSDVDLWSINRDDGGSYVHGTQKPVAVSARAINNSSKEGDVVLDLFGGSGSTLLACEQLNRRCMMMELDAHFADVIIARWEKFTGKTATKIN
jgi:DNA modification methylase